MGIFINNQNRREDYDLIAQLQNQINSYLANPNVDESAKSSARKQLEELSSSVNTYGSRKEARKFAISTLNSIASSLKPSEDDYTPQYITPTTGIKASATFDPQIGEQKYNVAGLTPNLKQRVDEFSQFLIDQLTFANNELAAGKLLYNWKDSNTSKINEWISKLQTPVTTEEDLKKRIDFMGNTIVNALASDSLAEAFTSRFAPWLEGSEEYAAAQAAADAEAQKAAKNPADLAAYPTLTSKEYIFEKGSDGKYIAYQVKDDGTKGEKAGQAGYMNTDFTSSGYKSGWIIGPNGVVTLINDFSDVTTYRDYLQTEGWEEAIKNAKDALQEKYPKAFNFTNTFDQKPFGEGIAHGNKNFVDLSYYFPGEGYVLGVQKDTDANNFEGYNWNEEDREFYVSKDGQNWEIVKGMAEVRNLLGLDGANGFKYEGADILADPNIDNTKQFDREGYLEKPEDWELIGESIYLKPINNYTPGEKQSAIQQIIELLQPGQYNKVAKTIASQRLSDITDVIDKSLKKIGHKQFYKWLFMYAQQKGLPKHILQGLLVQYRDEAIGEYWDEAKTIEYLEGRKTTSNAKGGVLKFSTGGEPWYVKYANDIPDSTSMSVEQETQSSDTPGALAERASASGRTLEGQTKGEGKFEWDAAMVLRAGALAADVAGLIASFVPGYGTAGAAVSGVASTGLDMTADVIDPSVTKGQVALNAAANLAFGIVGLIPGGKVWKVTKNLAKYGLFLTQMGAISPAIYSKLTSDQPLTYDDWKAVYAGLSALTGTASNIATAAKLKHLKVDTAPTKTGKHKAKAVGSNQEYEFTTAELEKIAIAGETKGQDAAVDQIKSILKQKYPDQAEAIENVDLGVNYGNVKGGKTRGSAGWRWHKRWNPTKTIQDVTTPVTIQHKNPVTEFYKDNPYRKGNPYNPKSWNSNEWGLFASDYALANGVRSSIIGLPWRPEWTSLKRLKAWGQDLTMGPGYQSRHNKLAEVEIGNTKHVRNIPKDHELIKVKNGDQEQVVEIAPLKNNNNETVPNEYVNVKDQNEVYTKTADGKFEKKAANQTAEPSEPTTTTTTDQITETKKSKLLFQKDIDEFNALIGRESTPKTGIEYTTTKASRKPYGEYKDLAKKAANKGEELMPKEKVNELLSKMATVLNQEYKPARTGGFIVNGKLIYNRSGGKLNRLNNYLNNK